MRKKAEMTLLRHSQILLLQASDQYLYCKGSPDPAQLGP